ncbi:TIGR03557 family F420-dependent LLM class oxidoreductase [Nocardioides mangrovicus]|uniref:TIGR03557 family F420-dependent LLM class oxidoreductase n=1 Tax=Nocardioides mangrovicus TaxID=2478913 RepID=A0A3L8NZ93_9ACTN|nr:TIGR03557 family F420-dependent LLM class oxidoreductase [Nocardioides mangrovicus]RLV48536.1 TIGR03557 family F420-dependent LLM class oxidoreductase [Nocardioides mangrovicus]
MELGFFLSCEEFEPEDLLVQARAATDAGFTSLWISDHYLPWNDAQGSSAFVWSVIGALSQVTDLPITTAVTCPIVRQHPGLVAQAAATCAVLTRGRFVLGIGTGEALNEHVFGDRWPGFDTRLEMLEESVEVMRMLWEGGFVSWRGEHYELDHARIYTLHEQPVPVYVSGFGPKATDLAARIGDGYVNVAPEGDLVRRFKDASGGKPAQGGAKVAYAPTRDEGIDLAHRIWPNDQLPGELAQVLPSPRHFEQASELVTREMVADAAVAGPDPEVHLQQVEAYREAGYDQMYVSNMGPHYLDMIEFYGREIIPTLGGSTS